MSVETREGAQQGERATLPWNPASYVSAGALSIAARSAFGEIDAAVLVADPACWDISLLDGPPGLIAASIEAAVAGPAWLAREIIRRFEARKEGRMLLVSLDEAEGAIEGRAAPGLAFSALTRGAFMGLGEGLFTRARGASWSAWGIDERSGKVDLAAAFALKLLDEPKTAKSGRWLPFTGRSGIFGVF
jgi:hypothetical protein